MQILSSFSTNFLLIISLFTACGVLIHDNHIDKAFSASSIHSSHDMTSHAIKSGSNLHTHSEQLSIAKDNQTPKALPRDRKKRGNKKYIRQGFHGDGYCIALAGEWV